MSHFCFIFLSCCGKCFYLHFVFLVGPIHHLTSLFCCHGTNCSFNVPATATSAPAAALPATAPPAPTAAAPASAAAPPATMLPAPAAAPPAAGCSCCCALPEVQCLLQCMLELAGQPTFVMVMCYVLVWVVMVI